MKYPVLSYKDFGRQLLKTDDLDPVYVMLHKHRGMDPERLKRWCLAYWSFYHVGVASRIAEAPSRKFYHLMQKAHDEKWPRGAERRHFRGESSAKAIAGMKSFGSAEKVVDFMMSGDDYQGIASKVRTFPLFGPWIAFKVADMAHTVLEKSVDYSNCTLEIYKDPRQGAALIRHGDWRHPLTDEELTSVVDELKKIFGRYKAPPRKQRKVGIMEVETILCKYKSHFKGSYPLFKDSREIFESLNGWGDLAEELRCLVPNQNKW